MQKFIKVKHLVLYDIKAKTANITTPKILAIVSGNVSAPNPSSNTTTRHNSQINSDTNIFVFILYFFCADYTSSFLLRLRFNNLVDDTKPRCAFFILTYTWYCLSNLRYGVVLAMNYTAEDIRPRGVDKRLYSNVRTIVCRSGRKSNSQVKLREPNMRKLL